MPDLKYSTRNPLGILAMFISFAYLSMVVCFTIGMDKLDGVCERMIMIGFLVLFPFVILYVFYNLITKHNGKLYGPRDYRRDEVFAMMSGNEIEVRNKKEIADVCHSVSHRDSGTQSCDSHDGISAKASGASGRSATLSALYDEVQQKAVDFVGRKLNIRFTENVKATIGSNTFEFDAVGDGRFGKYVLECKYRNHSNATFHLETVSAYLRSVAEAFDASDISYRLILAFVISGYSEDIASKIREYFTIQNPGVVTYVLDYSRLMADK